jgi:hypothetical protein
VGFSVRLTEIDASRERVVEPAGLGLRANQAVMRETVSKRILMRYIAKWAVTGFGYNVQATRRKQLPERL